MKKLEIIHILTLMGTATMITANVKAMAMVMDIVMAMGIVMATAMAAVVVVPASSGLNHTVYRLSSSCMG